MCEKPIRRIFVNMKRGLLLIPAFAYNANENTLAVKNCKTLHNAPKAKQNSSRTNSDFGSFSYISY